MKSKKCPVCGWDIKGGGISVKVGSKTITGVLRRLRRENMRRENKG